MNGILALAAMLTFDMVEETKMPCFIVEFDYYARVKVAMVAPLVLAGLCLCAGMILAVFRRCREARSREHEHANDSIFAEGLWTAAPFVLLALDFIHPLITSPS